MYGGGSISMRRDSEVGKEIKLEDRGGGRGKVEGTVQCRESITYPEQRPQHFIHGKVDRVRCAANMFT